MRIITISGLDGSGKSTQMQKLKSYLESQSKKVFYFHAIEFGLANRISSLSCCHNEKTKTSGVTKASAFKIWLRKAFLKIDLCRFKKLLAKLEKQGYDYLVSDRYFYDNVVNIAFLGGHPEFISGSQEMLKQVQHDNDSLAIYLKASPEIIMQRERKPEQGMEYLQKKEKLYDDLAREYNLKIVDGNQDKDKVFEEVRNLSR